MWAKSTPSNVRARWRRTSTWSGPSPGSTRIGIAGLPARSNGPGHEDYQLDAAVSHSALGTGDEHAADNQCPRTVTPPGEVDPFPNGKIVDKGCGAKKPDKTYGAPIALDVVVKP